MKADKTKVCHLLKTARGQIDGILNMIEEDRYCMDISAQLLAVEAVLKRANEAVLRAHIESCLSDTMQVGTKEEQEKTINELMGIIAKL